MSVPASAWITGYARTSMGAFGGRHAGRSVIELGVEAVVGLGGAVPPDALILGNVVSAGLGQAPARQIVAGAGLPLSTSAFTVNRVCASGLEATIQAARLMAGEAADVIVVGAESMSGAPFYDDAARFGRKFGDQTLRDGLFWDGLRDFGDGTAMGVAADALAEERGYSREEIDAWAAESVERARTFAGQETLDGEADEPLTRCVPEKLARLRPAFGPDGTTTAGNASPLTDGAAALRVRSARLTPTDARIVGWASTSGPTHDFVRRPVDAIERLLIQTGRDLADVALWEINEAFAVVALHAQRTLGLNPENVNARGGAVAMGHPLGATGTRLLGTLHRQLVARGGGLGVTCACVGGGEAVAVMIEVG